MDGVKLSDYLAPVSSIALLTLLAALPLSLPTDIRFFLPLLPVIAIHYWTLRHDSLLPEWLVFLFGLALDILTDGPLGYWSFIYLTTYLIALFSQPTNEQGRVARLAALLAALFAIALVAWLVASACNLALVDWKPFAIGAGLAAMCTVILLPMLRIVSGDDSSPPNANLSRGA